MASINAPIYTDNKYAVAPTNKQVPTKKQSAEMGKDDFLKLLIAQLKNQDPLNPMKDTEFIAQLATFSSLEQARNTSQSVEQASAVGMIGKTVRDSNNDEGTVSSVSIDDQGTVNLTINYKTTGKDGKPADVSKAVMYSEIREVKNQAIK